MYSEIETLYLYSIYIVDNIKLYILHNLSLFDMIHHANSHFHRFLNYTFLSISQRLVDSSSFHLIVIAFHHHGRSVEQSLEHSHNTLHNM